MKYLTDLPTYVLPSIPAPSLPGAALFRLTRVAVLEIPQWPRVSERLLRSALSSKPKISEKKQIKLLILTTTTKHHNLPLLNRGPPVFTLTLNKFYVRTQHAIVWKVVPRS